MRRSGAGVSGLRSAKSGVYGNNYFPNNDDDDYDNKPITVLGPLAPIFLPRDRTDPEALQNRLRIYSLCLITVSTFFWCWAVLNTLDLRKSGGVDLGIVSFFGSGWSSALLLKSSLGGKWYDKNQILGCCGKRVDTDDDDLYLGSSGGGRNAYGNNNNASKHHSAPGRMLRIFVVTTQILVVCNYLLGVLFAVTAGKQVYVNFATYCTTFALLWFLVCFGGFVLVRVYREALASTFGEEALNDRQVGLSCLRKLLLVLVNRSASSMATTTEYYDEDDDDEIDQELMSLVEGKGARYSTTS